MKVAVVGCDGYLGLHIMNSLKMKGIGCVGISHSNLNSDFMLDLKTPERFPFHFLSACDYILFLAAVSSPDLCQKNYDEAYLVNVTGTQYFIKKALEYNCKMLFFSSDAVFGYASGIVDELSVTKGDTPYGKMKKIIEDTFKNHHLFKSIRLSYVFSKGDRFTSYLLDCAKNQNTASIFHPFYRNCITNQDVLDTILWLLENWNNFDSTFLNICGQDLVSRVRIVDEINRLLPEKINYSIETPKPAFYMNRPAVLEMKSIYLKKILPHFNEPFSEKVRKQIG